MKYRCCGVPIAPDMWTRPPIRSIAEYRAELEQMVALAIIEADLELDDARPADRELLRWEANGARVALRHLGGYGSIVMDLEWAKRTAYAYERDASLTGRDA